MLEINKMSDGIIVYRRLLKHVIPYWKIFLLAIIGMVIYSTTDASFVAIMRPLIDDSFVKHDAQTTKWLPFIVIAIFIVRMISGFMSNYFMAVVARNIIRDLRKQMFSHLLELPVSYYDHSSPGKITAKLVYDVEQLASAASGVITIVIRDTLTIIALLSWMFYLSVLLTIVLLITTPFLTLLVVYVSRRFRKLSHRIQSSIGNVSHVAEEAIDGNRVIKVFGGQQYEVNQFAQINSYNRKQQLKLALTDSFSAPFIQLIVAVAFSFIIYMATNPGFNDIVSAGTFVSFITAMIMLMQPIKRLTNINSKLQLGIAAAHSIFSFLDQASEVDKGLLTIQNIKGEICFKNINFSYDNKSLNILSDINLIIKANQSIAFVGRSGAGKSTLVSLLPRFYLPVCGKVMLDGVDINDINLDSLREQIALVSQHVTLFNDTIEHNIAYGVLGETKRSNIINAATAAHAMEFIEKLPDGLDTMVGNDGVLLSGGQRQRIAIARAILKDAPILILDEATSALDTESERHIQAALQTLMKNRTTLVIAHRLSTIEHVDKIIVLDDGKIAETGSHQELINSKGIYAGLYEMQFNNNISTLNSG